MKKAFTKNNKNRHSERILARVSDCTKLVQVRETTLSQTANNPRQGETRRISKEFQKMLRGAQHDARKGFTLAEVLITLGIIGVVAAMTIPTLMAKFEKQQYVTQLKETYTVS